MEQCKSLDKVHLYHAEANKYEWVWLQSFKVMQLGVCWNIRTFMCHVHVYLLNIRQHDIDNT